MGFIYQKSLSPPPHPHMLRKGHHHPACNGMFLSPSVHKFVLHFAYSSLFVFFQSFTSSIFLCLTRWALWAEQEQANPPWPLPCSGWLSQSGESSRLMTFQPPALAFMICGLVSPFCRKTLSSLLEVCVWTLIPSHTTQTQKCGRHCDMRISATLCLDWRKDWTMNVAKEGKTWGKYHIFLTFSYIW